jgi:hypothetical protein
VLGVPAIPAERFMGGPAELPALDGALAAQEKGRRAGRHTK